MSRSKKTPYSIELSRDQALDYLAWEYGDNNAERLFEKLLPGSEPGTVRLPGCDGLCENFFRHHITRKFARATAHEFRDRILSATAFVCGKRGDYAPSGFAPVVVSNR